MFTSPVSHSAANQRIFRQEHFGKLIVQNQLFKCSLWDKQQNLKKRTYWQFYITCPVGIGLGCISKWLGWIPTVAPLRASTSPPPPLAYFQHITLSVPKSKIWYKLNLTTYNSICTCWHYFPKMVMLESKNSIPTVAKKSLDWTAKIYTWKQIFTYNCSIWKSLMEILQMVVYQIVIHWAVFQQTTNWHPNAEIQIQKYSCCLCDPVYFPF